MKVYGIYDMKDYEQCIAVFDNVKQIADYFNMSKSSVLSNISRGNQIKHRYKVERIHEEEEETEIISKSNEEIFQELLDAFQPKKIEFKTFDSFNWKLKRNKRQNNSR